MSQSSSCRITKEVVTGTLAPADHRRSVAARFHWQYFACLPPVQLRHCNRPTQAHPTRRPLRFNSTGLGQLSSAAATFSNGAVPSRQNLMTASELIGIFRRTDRIFSNQVRAHAPLRVAVGRLGTTPLLHIDASLRRRRERPRPQSRTSSRRRYGGWW